MTKKAVKEQVVPDVIRFPVPMDLQVAGLAELHHVPYQLYAREVGDLAAVAKPGSCEA